MLIRCPECTKEVSDRAPACPACGFPIAEHLAEARAAEAVAAERSSRELAGETDCVACRARGFVTLEFRRDDGQKVEGFSWCEICEHSGRVAMCRSDAGYWAVRRSVVEAFVQGRVDAHETDAVALGPEAPPPRYPKST